MNLIPLVRSYVPSSGSCTKNTLHFLRKGNLNAETIRQIREQFPGISFCEAAGGHVLEFLTEAGLHLPPAEDIRGTDAYAIQITPGGIRIDAPEEAGLFYGLQTLFQMPDRIPCGMIRDDASIKYRIIHWDLKGYQPKLKYMLDELRLLASYKINAILLEIEDKYDYHCAPEVGCKGAFTYGDLRKISRLAAALHITIIPKLQCIAHVDYILKHRRYHKLRENGHCFQFCPADPAVHRLWSAMAEELMDCFSEHRQFFHIGGDEPMFLGECPECRRIGRAQIYYQRLNQCIDFIAGHGRTPVVWDDIIRNNNGTLSDEGAQKCRELGKKAILMYWAYGYNGVNNSFPYLKGYLAEGLKIFGASGFAGCDNWVGSIPPLEFRGRNIDAWTKTAVEHQLEGVVATGWTRIGSADAPAEPQESSWFTILYAAGSMWSGRPVNPKQFVHNLAQLLYGECPEPELVDAIINIGKHPYLIANLDGKDNSCRRMNFLRLAAATESLSAEMDSFFHWNQCYFGKMGKKLEGYRLDYLNRFPKMSKDKITTLKKQMTQAVREFYIPFTADEFILSRFGYPEKIIADTEELIRKTKKI